MTETKPASRSIAPLFTLLAIAVFAVVVAIGFFKKTESPTHSSSGGDGMFQTGVVVRNATAEDTHVYVAFSPESSILPADWTFCKSTYALECNFPLLKDETKELPVQGRYLNATFSFGEGLTCNTTKAEVNINNPGWADTTDVSLVDGYSNKVSIVSHNPGEKHPVVLGPPKGKEGNEKVFGLFPLGCDICVARKSPPCGIAKGRDGCKRGTQYNPDVPCQYQRPKKGGKLVVIFHGK